MFNHLKVPESWNSYFSKYPNGLTIMEALCDWVGQVDSMVDHINTVDEHIDYLNKNLEEFYLTFQENLSQEIMKTLQSWIEDGTLEQVISQLIENRMTFPSIPALQQAPNIFKNGTVVELLGYHYSGDGAGHKRIISDVDDGSGVLVGNKWANLVHNGTIELTHFGVVENEDISDILNKIYEIQSIFSVKINANTVYKIAKNTKIKRLYGVERTSRLEIQGDVGIKMFGGGTLEGVFVRDYNENKTVLTIEAIGASNTVRNCYLAGADYGEVGRNYKHGLAVNPSETGNSYLFRMENNRTSNFFVELNITDSYINNNELWGNNRNFALKLGSSTALVSNNQIVGGFDGAIIIESAKYGTDQIQIVDNYFDGSWAGVKTGKGILLKSSSYSSIISNNYFHQQDSTPISLESTFNGVISGNTFWNCDSRDVSGTLIKATALAGATLNSNTALTDRVPIKTGVSRVNKLKFFDIASSAGTYQGSNFVSGNTTNTNGDFVNSTIGDNIVCGINDVKINNGANIDLVAKLGNKDNSFYTTTLYNNADDIKHSSKYYFGSGITNAPQTGNCMLETEMLLGSSTMGHQRFTRMYDGTVYHRVIENGVWKAWKRLDS